MASEALVTTLVEVNGIVCSVPRPDFVGAAVCVTPAAVQHLLNVRQPLRKRRWCGSLLGGGDGLPHLFGGAGHVDVADTQVADCVDDG